MGYMADPLVTHRRVLRNWRRITDARNQRVIDAFNDGLSKMEIHRLTGISRMQIDRILNGKEEAQCQR